MLARRSLLSAVLLAPAARAAPGGLRLETGPEGVAALTGPGVRRSLLLPGSGARLLAPVACGGEAMSVVSFQLEEAGARVEWAALAVAVQDRVALLALEPLSWRGADGARMSTRLMAAGDRRHVLLQRDSAEPLGPTLWRREAWTDMLAWQAPAGLADAPVRPPLPGTRQHAVAAWRRRAAAVVAGGPSVISPALLAGIATGFGQEAMVPGKASAQAKR